ncbi:MAG: ABC transporter substrate-binding protein [Gammaproteobacteria bacterium]|nr:ABC transporter substrate-binding protein [Gammaproteobacteria bacterium]
MRHVLAGAAALLLVTVATPAADARELTVAFAAEPPQTDPTRAIAGVDAYFLTLFYEQLLNVDPHLARVNWLAESWSLAPAGEDHVLSVKIREGVKFHNGDTLSAHDFRYAYERQRDPVSRSAVRFRYVRDLVVRDDLRFDVVFDRPDALFEQWNLALWAVPRRYFQAAGDAGIQAHPVGTGPWKFVSRKPREELVVERFEDYWNASAKPRAQRLVIKIIPEDTTRVAAFKTGTVDWIDAVPPAQVAGLASLPHVQVASLPTANNLYLGMNAVDPRSPLADVRVRQAVAHAIDIDAIIEHIVYGQGVRTVQVAPGTLGYDERLAPYAYDPERSRALLAEAGYPRGFNVNCYNLTTPREPNIKEVGEAAFAFLTAVGIRCRIVQMEYGAWVHLLRTASRPTMDGIISAMGWQGLPGDPTDAWSGHLHTFTDRWGRVSYHADPELDGLVRTLRTTLDPDRRQRLARRIARLKHERVAGGLPTYRPVVSLAWRDTIAFRPWPAAYWRSMYEIDLAP